jgi:uncharacterized protein (TIGR02266 family)
MSTQPTPSNSSSSREAGLTRAEADMAQLEARLAEQVARAVAEAQSLTLRLEELRTEASQLPAEDASTEEVRTAVARLESASVHTESLEDTRERAMAAREEALEARRRATTELQQVMRSFQQLTSRARQELSEVESGFSRAREAARTREAAARAERESAARAEKEAATRAQREAARAQAPRSSPQVPAPAQGLARPPAEAAMPERTSRVHLRAAIDLRSDSNFFTGFSTNISEGGIFIATVQSLPRGTTVELDFTLPGGKPLRVHGVVRWKREVNDRTPDLMPGLGVQFVDLPPEVANAISGFVANREPLFFPD